MRNAAREGLLSAEVTSGLDQIKELASREIDEFLYYPYGDNVLAQCCAADSEDNRMTLYYLIDGILERAAKFVAFSLTAV
jgi:hexokinase